MSKKIEGCPPPPVSTWAPEKLDNPRGEVKEHCDWLTGSLQGQSFLWKAETHGRSNQSQEKTKLERWAESEQLIKGSWGGWGRELQTLVWTLSAPEGTGRSYRRREMLPVPQDSSLWGVGHLYSNKLIYAQANVTHEKCHRIKCMYSDIP